MFNNYIESVTLVNDIANQVFRNIAGDTYNGDTSFIATLRAVLAPRVGDNTVRLFFNTTTIDEYTIKEHGIKAIVDSACTSLDAGVIQILSVQSRYDAARNAFFDKLDDADKGFLKTFNGFEDLPDVRDYISKVARTRFYINPSTKTSFVVVEKMNNRLWHYIQAFIPRLVRWFFESNPVTEEEKALFTSLTRKVSVEYEALIEKFAEKYDLRAYAIKSIIGDLEKRSRERQISDVSRAIERAREELARLLDAYTDKVAQLDDYCIRHMGLVEALNKITEDSELIDYFTANKNLDILSSDGTRFDFIVRTYLELWDPEIFERSVQNKDSMMYTGYEVGYKVLQPAENREKFFKALFSDEPKFRLKMCGYYSLDIRGAATSRSGYAYPQNCKDYIPNPHLHRFNCLGTFERHIIQAITNGNTIGAVEQCIASCKSINLAEATYTHMLETVFRSSAKCIELLDGTCMTSEEAMKWLLANEGE